VLDFVLKTLPDYGLRPLSRVVTLIDARQLALSEEAVKGQVRNILSKLGAKDRTHAAMIGLKRGIIQFQAGVMPPRPTRPLGPNRNGHAPSLFRGFPRRRAVRRLMECEDFSRRSPMVPPAAGFCSCAGPQAARCCFTTSLR
jgi:hypothetical protein